MHVTGRPVPALVDTGGAVETPLGTLAYTEVGTGPPAVFLHGVLLNRHLWDGVVPAVADGRRCIVVDLPGHGSSPPPSQTLSLFDHAEMLAVLCDSLGAEAVDVVANDSGGAIAQVFAARHPGRVSTLTLTNCDVHSNLPPPAFAEFVRLAEHGELAGLLTATLEGGSMGEMLAVGFADPASLAPEEMQRFVAPLSSPHGPEAVQQFLVGLRADDLMAVEAELRTLDVPTLVVWGTDDMFFETAWAYWLRDTIPGVTEVVEVEGGRLFFPFEQPGALVPHVRRLWGLAS